MTISGITTITAESGSAEATNIYNSLQSGIEPGKQIAGMKIVSSSSSINGGTLKMNEEQGGSSNKNLGLILGLSIPLGLAALFIIGVLIKKYAISSSSRI